MSDSREPTAARAAGYVEELCMPFPDRHVGGDGNRAANDFFAQSAVGFGFEVERLAFECLDWEHEGCTLESGDDAFEVYPGPYSPPLETGAPLLAVSGVEELERTDARGAILLLHGDLVREQMTPKHYPFYRWEKHTRILEALERAEPVAVVAATGRSSELVGALYPFPFIEDGDFKIPTAYMTDVEGERLLPHAGTDVRLHIESQPIPTSAEQVIATRQGTTPGRIVVTAHIDSRDGTPGALDNATGVAVLLVLAELLSQLPGNAQPTVELVPFNGEDNYAAPGQVAYLEARDAELGQTVLNVNIDGAAWIGHRAEVSLYECPTELAESTHTILQSHTTLAEGPEWPQSDHMIFVMRGIPAIAITSENASDLRWRIAHTERDTPDLVDPDTIIEVARFIADVIQARSASASSHEAPATDRGPTPDGCD